MIDLLIDAGTLLGLTIFSLWQFYFRTRFKAWEEYKKRKRAEVPQAKPEEISWDDLIGLVYETQNRWSPFGNYKRIFFEFDTNGHCKVFEQAGRGSQAVAVVDVLGGSSKEAVARAIKVCNHYYLAQELVKEKN